MTRLPFHIPPALLASILLSALLTLAAGCASPSDARRTAATTPGDDSTRTAMLEMMRTVEREPLAATAPAMRTRAFDWVASAPELRGFDMDAQYLDELDRGVYPFKGEMMMQYIFGMVLWRFSPEGTSSDRIAQAEAGLRSMIAAYRNILQSDRKLSDPWLDRLDELRRLGRLRAFVEEFEARR